MSELKNAIIRYYNSMVEELEIILLTEVKEIALELINNNNLTSSLIYLDHRYLNYLPDTFNYDGVDFYISIGQTTYYGKKEVNIGIKTSYLYKQPPKPT